MVLSSTTTPEHGVDFTMGHVASPQQLGHEGRRRGRLADSRHVFCPEVDQVIPGLRVAPIHLPCELMPIWLTRPGPGRQSLFARGGTSWMNGPPEPGRRSGHGDESGNGL